MLFGFDSKVTSYFIVIASDNEIKNKTYHNVRTTAKLNIKIAERGKIDTPNSQIHDRTLCCLDIDTSIKKMKEFLGSQTSSLSEMMRSCKCFPQWVNSTY